MPEGALKIVEREADEFDEKAVEEHMSKLKKEAEADAPVKIAPHPHAHDHGPGGGCPGARMIQFDKPPAGDSDDSDDWD